LAQEAESLVKNNKSIRYFILKNHGVIGLGGTIAEAWKLIEDMHSKAESMLKTQSRKGKNY